MTEHWIPDENSLIKNKKCWIDSMLNDLINEKLVIGLRIDEERFEVIFDSTVLYCNISDESVRFESFDQLKATYGGDFFYNSTMFQVKDSELIKDLTAKSYDTISANDLVHIAIMSVDTFLHVVSYSPPIIEEK